MTDGAAAQDHFDPPMTIGAHLEELRLHVLKALGWVGLALLVCLGFQEQLMRLALLPHQRVVRALEQEARARDMSAILAARLVERAQEVLGEDAALERALEGADRARAIAREKARPAHDRLEALAAAQVAVRARLDDLRARLEAAAREDPPEAARLAALDDELAAARAEAEALRAEVARDVRPLLDKHAVAPKLTLQSLRPQDTFLAFLKLSIVAALFLASPLVVRQLWRFISTGLYPHEKRHVSLFAPLSFGAFITGFMFGYLVLIPLGLRFLASYAPPDLIVGEYSIEGYLSLFITLSLVTGAIFELPLIMCFLALIGVVTADGFRRIRRYAILVAFVVAAILTPPDPVTQTLLAIPLLLLYELGIWLGALVERARRPGARGPAPAPGPPASAPAVTPPAPARVAPPPVAPPPVAMVPTPDELRAQVGPGVALGPDGLPLEADPPGAEDAPPPGDDGLDGRDDPGEPAPPAPAPEPSPDPLAPRPAPPGTVAAGALHDPAEDDAVPGGDDDQDDAPAAAAAPGARGPGPAPDVAAAGGDAAPAAAARAAQEGAEP